MVNVECTLFIDSRNRTSGTTENFTWNFSPGIVNYTYFFVRSITIPRTFYNVQQNSVILSIAGTPVTVGLDAGNYTTTELCSALQAALIAQDMAGWVVTWNVNTKNVEIQGPSGVSRAILWGTNSSTKAFAVMMGFPPVNDALSNPYFNFSASTISSYPGFNNIIVRSSQLAQSLVPTSVFGNQFSDVIEIVNVQETNTVTDSIVLYKPANSRKHWGTPGSGVLRQIDLRLQDDQGNDLSLNSTVQGWQIEIVVVFDF